jgi:CBS domain-containing protein
MICPTCGTPNLPGADLCEWCSQDLAHFDRPQPYNRVDGSLMDDTVQMLDPHPPICVPLTGNLGFAVALMCSQHVGSVLVVDASGKLVGILTERDFLTRAAGQTHFAQLPIRAFMTRDPETVAPTDPLGFALAKMDVGGYRHLPVTDEGIPVGVISARDVLKYLLQLCE